MNKGDDLALWEEFWAEHPELGERVGRSEGVAAHNPATAFLCGAEGVERDVVEARRCFALAVRLGAPYAMPIEGTGGGEES